MSRARKGYGDYVVGRGRPPVATRFKPGHSGNPKGRPKKPKTVSRILNEALQRKVRVEENGRPCTRTVEQIMIANIVNAAAKQNLKAVQLVLAMRERYQDSPETTLNPDALAIEDAAILRDYMTRAVAIDDTEKDPNAPNQGGAQELGMQDKRAMGGGDSQ